MFDTQTNNDSTAQDALDLVQKQFVEAARIIDSRFGAGYAIRNPALVSALISAAAANFATMQRRAVNDR